MTAADKDGFLFYSNKLLIYRLAVYDWNADKANAPDEDGSIFIIKIAEKTFINFNK